MRTYLKNKSKRFGGMDQVVEHLVNKCDALNSNSNTAKKIIKIKINK
jgi:hypothetical protein